MKEYNVSLRKPNKKYVIKKEDRIKDHLKNILTVRKYFVDRYGVVPPVSNGDQMPFRRNESASQKTLSLKSEEVFIKENYMLSRERVTCITQLFSDPKIELKSQFIFKVKVHEHISLLQKAHIINWLQKDLIELEQILGMIDKLPNRFNMFTEQSFAIYVLDDYSVYLIPDVREALFKKVYVLVVICGSITGNIQINDKNCHRDLKKH